MKKKLGLIGKTLTYSYSKVIHEYLLAVHNIEGSYDLIEVDAVDKDMLAGYDGLNITIPYKEDVVPLLDEVHVAFPVVNTVKNIDGTYHGFNTDIAGFHLLVEKLGVAANRVVILGAGGTSKMIQKILGDRVVAVVSRSASAFTFADLPKLSGDILINTTTIGMQEFASPIDAELLKNFKGVIDLNYNPMNSKLALDAQAQDIPFIGGLYMLIEQAIKSFEIWLDIDVAPHIREDVYNHVCFKIFDKIALVGMPLSGKTTIVQKYNGLDLDDAIIQKYDATPGELLARGTFRDAETATLASLVAAEEKLIALGGGAILKLENIALLKDYLIIFLDTPLDELKKRRTYNERPLLPDEAALIQTYETRLPLYEARSNIRVSAEQLEELLQ